METKKTAPKGGLRRSKHARVRGLGAESSLEPSLACRRLGANDFGVPRICPGRRALPVTGCEMLCFTVRALSDMPMGPLGALLLRSAHAITLAMAERGVV